MTERTEIAVITVSDRCSRGEAEDRSGPALADAATRLVGPGCRLVACVPDDADAIERAVREQVEAGTPLVLTTGGTGLGPRDVTPEAVGRVIERPFPQLLELCRARCLPASPRAFLSRGTAGVAGRTLIVTLPGSPSGCVESLELIADVLPHALDMLAGGGHGRPER